MSDFTPAQRRLREEVRALLCHPEIRAELDLAARPSAPGRPEPHPWRLYRQLGARGWLAPHWPVRYGGLGLTWVETGIVAEELARHGAPDTAIVNGIYNVGELVLSVGSPAQRQRYLPRLAGGDLVATALLTEPSAGSDLAALRTRAERLPGRWSLTGVKMWAAKVHLAEVAVCAARTGPGAGHADISLFLVPLDAAEVHAEPVDTVNVETLHRVVFDRLPLLDEHLLGGAGHGWPHLVRALTLERAGLGYHGRVRRWVDALAAHLRRLDVPPTDELWCRLRDLNLRIAAGRELAWAAVRELADRGPEHAAATAAAAKWFNTELGTEVVAMADAVGADADALDSARREAIGLTLAAGTSEMMLSIVQADLRRLLRDPAPPAEPAGSTGPTGPAGPAGPAESARSAGRRGERPPDLGRLVLHRLAPGRTGDGRGVVLAAAGHGHGDAARPGPVAVEPTGDGWSVTGTRWALSGPDSEPLAVLVPLTLDGSPLSVALLPTDRPGVRVEPLSASPGPTTPLRVHLDKVVVRPADLVASATTGPAYQDALACARLVAANYLLGSADRLLGLAVDRADNRRQFDRPLSANQAVGHALAAAHSRARGAALVVHAADRRAGSAVPPGPAAALVVATTALVLATDAAVESARLAIRVHGAEGLRGDGPVQATLRWQRYPLTALGAPAAVRTALTEAAGRTGDAVGTGDATVTVGPVIADGTAGEPPVHRLFESWAARRPAAVAVTTGGEHVTYGELNAGANRVAHALRRLGVGPDVPVAVCVERSADLIMAVLGVLKAGGAYVPLAPADPPGRLREIIDRVDPAVVVTHDWMLDWLPADRLTLCLDTDQTLPDAPVTDLGVTPHPANLMSVTFTSGSTGAPKGVMVTHGGITNRIAWDRAMFPLPPDGAVLQLTSIAFDPSVWEIFAALTSGARLILLPPATNLDPRLVVEVVRSERVTALTAVPAHLALLVDQDPGLLECPSLRYVFCGGDVLPPALAARFTGAGPALYNMYGPTEVSIDATAWRCGAGSGRSVPIGRPIANVRAEVLDADLRPVRDGRIGELWVGGAGLARGYWGAAAATAAVFRPDRNGGRLYRTGDLVRRLADGVLEFHGRTDRQIKIRGHRVEPAEVEAALMRIPGVRAAAAAAVADRLIGYVEVDRAIDLDEARRLLRAELPGHLVPARLVPVAALPRTAVGKVDHRALAVPTGPPAVPATPAEPAADVRTALTRLYSDMLGVSEVTADDEFFALGGDSLRAAQLVTLARRDLGLALTMELLLRAPSIRELVELAAHAEAGA